MLELFTRVSCRFGLSPLHSLGILCTTHSTALLHTVDEPCPQYCHGLNEDLPNFPTVFTLFMLRECGRGVSRIPVVLSYTTPHENTHGFNNHNLSFHIVLVGLLAPLTISFVFSLLSPPFSLGFTILGEMFTYVAVFVIQPLRKPHSVFVDGACCVFLLPAFTRLGYECQDLLSPRDGMHVCTDLVYTLIRKTLGPGEGGGGGVRTHVNSKGKMPCTGKILLRGSNP